MNVFQENRYAVRGLLEEGNSAVCSSEPTHMFEARVLHLSLTSPSSPHHYWDGE